MSAESAAPGQARQKPAGTESVEDSVAESAVGSDRRGLVLPVGVAVLVVALAVAAAMLSWKHHQDKQVDDRALEAKAFAEQAVVRLLAYTPESVSSDLDSESGLLTGSFKKDYRDLVTDTIAPAAEKSKVTTSADVVSAGVISASANRVDLLLFLNVTSTTAADKTPQVNGSRIEVRVERVDGHWHIVKMDPV